MKRSKQDEALLVQLRTLQDYELSAKQQEHIIHSIRNAKVPTRKPLLIKSSLAALAALLIVALSSVLWVTREQEQPRHLAVEPDNEWKLSQRFDLKDKDGSVVYEKGVRGIEGKVGYLDNGLGDFVARDRKKGAKAFWYVWGNPDQLVGKTLKATAIHKDTGESFILDESELSPGLYGEDAHSLTSFEPFPSEGIWKINVVIDDRPYASIVIEVQPGYIQSGKFIFLINERDLSEGLTKEVQLEITGKRKEQEITVTAQFLEDAGHELKFPYNKTLEYKTGEGMDITEYTGKITLDRKGKWKLTVLGDSVEVVVK